MNYGTDLSPEYLDAPPELGQYGGIDATLQRAQQALLARGISVGPDGADGLWGTNTANAVKTFQASQGLPITGVIDSATQQALFGGQSSAKGGGAAEFLTKIFSGFAQGYNPPPVMTSATGTGLPGQPGYPGQLPSKPTPGWVMPVAVVGGLALVGGLVFMAMKDDD